MIEQSSLNTSTEQALSVGEQFRRVREQLNLSIDEAAKKLNLRPIIIQCIENNEFSQKKIPPTFMKGYVRNYARLLKLPEQLWINAVENFGDIPRNDFNKGTRIEKVTNPHSNNRWVGYLTTLIICFIVAMTALWWWENYQQSRSERDNLVQSYTPTISTTNDNANSVEIKDNTVIPSTTEKSLENNEQLLQPIKEPETKSAVENPVILPVAENMPQLSVQEATSTEEKADNSTNAVLHIEITAETSWISVKNATSNKVLAQKEYKAGEVLNFDNDVPYALIIGAPANVKITYKGETYPLKVDGRVAKFKLQ